MPPTRIESSPLRVLIVDRHEVSRGAIRALLQTEGVEVLADVATAEEALALALKLRLDVAIVDIRPGDPAGLALARALARHHSSPLVVLASTHSLEKVPNGGYPLLAKADIGAERLQQLIEIHNPNHQEPSMSLQAYYDSITAQTGKTPDEFVALAQRQGLTEPGVRPSQVIAWLKDDHGLGHGHAMAIVAAIKKHRAPEASVDEKVARHFAGKKSGWRPVYEQLLRTADGFGPDTDVAPGTSYLSLRKAGRKFAIVQVRTERLDLGLKLKGVPAAGRLESAGRWNAMVTHRVRIHTPADVDQELFGWLGQAYATA